MWVKRKKIFLLTSGAFLLLGHILTDSNFYESIIPFELLNNKTRKIVTEQIEKGTFNKSSIQDLSFICFNIDMPWRRDQFVEKIERFINLINVIPKSNYYIKVPHQDGIDYLFLFFSDGRVLEIYYSGNNLSKRYNTVLDFDGAGYCSSDDLVRFHEIVEF